MRPGLRSLGAALRSPGDYFLKALDNKPPGTAWFYWIINHALEAGTDPRPARLVLVAWLALIAWLVGRTVTLLGSGGTRGRGPRAELWALSPRGWYAVVGCLAASALPVPEQLSGTTELIATLPLCATLWFVIEARARRFGTTAFGAAGLVFGTAFVLKQTLILFAPVAVVGLVWLWRSKQARVLQLAAFGASALVPLVATVWWLGAGPLWYWSWVYPYDVMRPARSSLFSETKLGLEHVAIFALVCWPLVAGSLLGRARRFRRERPVSLWISAWIASACGAVLMGKGLFFHYFLFLAPFLAAAAALSARPRALGLLVGAACAVSVVAGIPQAGFLWGTDLNYYERLGQAIRDATASGERIFVWGGNALPESISGRLPSTRFLTARYLLPAYSTPELARMFRDDFEAHPPELIVDVHERGDDCFSLRPASIDWLRTRLSHEYVASTVPGLPWATLYRRRPVLPGSTVRPTPAFFPELADRSVLAPERLARGDFAAWSLFARSAARHWRSARALESLTRTWQALTPLLEAAPSVLVVSRGELLENAIARQLDLLSGNVQQGVDADDDRLLALDTRELVRHEYAARHWATPLSLDSSVWWGELALVKMQPRAVVPAPRAPASPSF